MCSGPPSSINMDGEPVNGSFATTTELNSRTTTSLVAANLSRATNQSLIEQLGLAVPSTALPQKQRARRPRVPRAEKPLPQPRQTAKVKELADTQVVGKTATHVETKILERIKKCLDRANHPNTPEAEAQAALRMSSRLMAAANVTQADVLSQASTAQEQAQLGGRSIVSITSTKNASRVINQTWVIDVANAMTVFFDCKQYSVATNSYSSIQWVFYCISQNTAAAATAFEMSHNIVLEWARSKKGTSRNDYCLGVGRGLLNIAYNEKRDEELKVRQREKEALAQTEKEEDTQERSRLDRLHVQPGTPSQVQDGLFETTNDSEDSATYPDDNSIFGLDSESDSDIEESDVKPTFTEMDELPIDLTADPIEEILRSIKKEEEDSEDAIIASTSDDTIRAEDRQIKVEDDNDDASQLVHWTSSKQLTRFRQSAEAVAEEYLKSKNTKLGKGRARKRTIRDWSVYDEGRRDSKNIDVKRKRIREA